MNWRPISTLATAVVVAALITLGVRGVAGWIEAPTSLLGAAAIEGGLNLLLFGVLAAAALLAMWRDGSIAERFGAVSGAGFGAGFGLGFIGLLTAFLLAALAGVSTKGQGSLGWSLVFAGTLLTVVQAGAEELYFRGWLLGSLERAWRAWPALIVSAAAFAALHLLGGARAPLSLVNLLLGGLLFGLLAQRTRGLTVPIAAHIAWNWTEGLLLGLDPNPGTGSFGAIWDYDLVGAAAWGGSGEGLNASLAVSAVLIALVIPLALWPDQRQRLSRSGWPD